MLHNKPYLQLLARHKQAPVVRVYLLADYEDDKPSSIVSVDNLLRSSKGVDMPAHGVKTSCCCCFCFLILSLNRMPISDSPERLSKKTKAASESETWDSEREYSNSVQKVYFLFLSLSPWSSPHGAIVASSGPLPASRKEVKSVQGRTWCHVLLSPHPATTLCAYLPHPGPRLSVHHR